MDNKNEQFEFELFEWDYDFEKELQIIKLKQKNGKNLNIYRDTSYDMGDIFLIDANCTINYLIKNIKCPCIFFPNKSGILKIDENKLISITGWNRNLFINTQFEQWDLWLKSHKKNKYNLRYIRAYILVKILKMI